MPVTVDISSLTNARPNARPNALADVAAQIAHACDTSGFFYLKGHGIPSSDFDKILTTTRAFFDTPVSTKSNIAIDRNNRGYLGFGEAKMYGSTRPDLKEVFFFGRDISPNDPLLTSGLPLVGLNQWPTTPTTFRGNVLDYLSVIQQVGDRLLEAFAVSLGASRDFFSSRYRAPMSRGQLIHYPPIGTDVSPDQFSVAEHSDFGCITLLLQEVPGLEVLTKSGQWIPIPPEPETLVVNIGDLLERWTNGRLPSTKHRVRNVSGLDRYSVAIFHDPDSAALIDPEDLDAGSTSGNQLADSEKFSPIMAGEYILGRSAGVFAQFKDN